MKKRYRHYSGILFTSFSNFVVTAKNGNYVCVQIPTYTELIATKLLDLHGLPLSKNTLNGLYYLFANSVQEAKIEVNFPLYNFD